MPSKAPIHIKSADPEVMALQAIVRGLQHMNGRDLTPRGLKVLTCVELMKKEFKFDPNAKQIASFLGLALDELESELEFLCDQRYLIATHPFQGDLVYTYKKGPMGGTALRHILNRKRVKKTT